MHVANRTVLATGSIVKRNAPESMIRFDASTVTYFALIIAVLLATPLTSVIARTVNMVMAPVALNRGSDVFAASAGVAENLKVAVPGSIHSLDGKGPEHLDI